MYRKEGEQYDLMANSSSKSKQKLDQACNEGGWIKVLASLQDGTYLFREEFRDALRWILILLLLKPPSYDMTAAQKLKVEYV